MQALHRKLYVLVQFLPYSCLETYCSFWRERKGGEGLAYSRRLGPRKTPVSGVGVVARLRRAMPLIEGVNYATWAVRRGYSKPLRA